MTPGGTPIPPKFQDSGQVDASWGDVKLGKSALDTAVHSQPERLEKHVPDLPILHLTNIDPSSVVSDWLAEATPIISSLSASAGEWWRQVISDAETSYEQWLAASPTNRLELVPDKDATKYRYGRYALLEQRVVSMLLKVLPDVIKQEAIATRSMSTTALLFRMLCKVQPGSAADKSSMITYIVTPATSNSPQAALEAYRKWIRVCRRLVEVRAQLPDPSLRLNGLDRIGQQVFMGIPGAQFRINTWREQHRMDYDPTHAKVDQLVLLLVAELELATAHAPGIESSQRPPKHPRVSKVEADAHQDSTREAALDVPVPKAKGKGKYSSPKGRKGASPQLLTPNKEEPTASKTLCKGYLTAKGCAYGDSCKFTHDYAEAGRRALCYACGATNPELAHRRPDCPANQRMASPPSSPNKNREF